MIDWSKAPEWASWAFMTKSCVWFWSKSKPRWDDSIGDWVGGGQAEKMEHQPSAFGVDWEMSLRPRYPIGRWRRGGVGSSSKSHKNTKHTHYHKPTSGAYLVDLEWVLNAWGVQCEHVRSAIGALLGADHQGAKPTNGAEKVDVYWVLNAWEVDCHAKGHAIKKLLNAGQRGAKSKRQDLQEAIDSIVRAIELLDE